MTIEEVSEKVAAVRKASDEGDDEKAHDLEDELRHDILVHYSENGCELAKAALQTTHFDFNRWCA